MDRIKLFEVLCLLITILGILLIYLFSIFSRSVPSTKFEEYLDQVIKFNATIVKFEGTTVSGNLKYVGCDSYGCFYIISRNPIDCKSIIGKAYLKRYGFNYYLFLREILQCSK